MTDPSTKKCFVTKNVSCRFNVRYYRHRNVLFLVLLTTLLFGQLTITTSFSISFLPLQKSRHSNVIRPYCQKEDSNTIVSNGCIITTEQNNPKPNDRVEKEEEKKETRTNGYVYKKTLENENNGNHSPYENESRRRRRRRQPASSSSKPNHANPNVSKYNQNGRQSNNPTTTTTDRRHSSFNMTINDDVHHPKTTTTVFHSNDDVDNATIETTTQIRTNLDRMNFYLIEHRINLAAEYLRKTELLLQQTRDCHSTMSSFWDDIIKGWVDIGIAANDDTVLHHPTKLLSNPSSFPPNNNKESYSLASHHLLRGYFHFAKLDLSHAQTAERILLRLADQFPHQNHRQWFHSLLKVYGTLHKSTTHVQRLFRIMQHSTSTQPNEMTYTLVLHALVKSKRMTTARQFLTNLEQATNLQPNIYLYNTLLYGYATCCRQPHTAELFLQEMKHKQVTPDDVSYKILLLGYKLIGSGPNARRFLQKIRVPSVVDYNNVIAAFAKHPCHTKDLKSAKRLLETMEFSEDLKPTVVTYTAYMDGLCRCSQPHQVLRLYARVRKLYQQTSDEKLKPNVYMYNSVLKAYAQLGDYPHMESLFHRICLEEDVDQRTYGIVMNAYAKRGRASKALQILHTLQKPSSKINPNAIMYNAVLKAHSNEARLHSSLLSAQTAHKLLTKMSHTGYHPDVVSYSTVITAYAQLGYPAMAQEVLKQCPNPNVVSYNAVLNGYAIAGDPVMATELLWRMECRPDVVSLNTCLHAWAKSSSPDKVERAWNLYLRFRSRYKEVVPDLVTYNTILNACASSSSSTDVLRIAVLAYRHLHHNKLKPNHVTFATLLKIGKKAFPPKSDEQCKYVKRVYGLCVEEGCVTDSVRRSLKGCGVPLALYEELCGMEEEEVD